MSYNDDSCVLKLCIALEIMECKIRKLKNRKVKDYALRLYKDAALWKQSDKKLITQMFADRGHIGHGKSPYNISKNPILLVNHLETSFEVYSDFLKASESKDWNYIVQLQT